MKMVEIQKMWDIDSVIDKTELGNESLKIPSLHSKYFKFYSNERIVLKECDFQYKKLYKIKYEYFQGLLSVDELKQHGWEPNQLKILKTDIPMYLDADTDLTNLKRKIYLQEEKLNFLESIIKSLSNRGFQIKSAIDWVKFTQGL
jgi:hypothetical protein